MLNRLIESSVKNRFLVSMLVVIALAAGAYAVKTTPLDAIPDLSDVQVIIFTEFPGQAPQVVEDQVTYPLTTTMLSVPRAQVVRGYSFFGFSFVYIIFEDGTDMYWARSRVLEYLNYVADRLPKGVSPALGTTSIAAPTDLVEHTGQRMTIDGVDFEFQYAPHSEAPAELTFHLPQHRAFCGAEIVSQTMHNLYTLRGAQVRDARLWSGYIDEALRRFGDRTDVVFNSHHWPVWGRERVVTYLEQQRDTYRYLHDQTLRLANAGLTPQEIAEELEMPATLRAAFASRGYYGTVRHNAKGVYQDYFGWYDGNPAHLDPLPPVEAGRRIVDAMGGAEAVLGRAQHAFGRGEYRWAAMLLDHLVFADPDAARARELLAATYDQLGYVAESGPWRDAYLTGAF